MRVTFLVVKATGVRFEMIGGKRRRRQRTFTQTVNPWNRNDDGCPKTRAEVKASVQAEAAAWADETTPRATLNGASHAR